MWILLVAFAHAQSPEFTPSLEYRPRVEWHTGRDGTAQSGDDVFVSHRARVGGVGRLDDVSVGLVFQDVRVWGEEEHTLFDATANRFDLHEGFLRVKLGSEASLKVGRQEINLHEHRLVGNVGWTQQARAFDAVRLQGGKTGLNGELSLAILGDDSEAIPPAPVAVVGRPWWQVVIGRGGWAGEEGAALADAVYILSAVNSDDGDPANDGMIHTAGAYAKGGTGALRGRVEGYGQLGAMGRVSRQAWMVGVAGTVAPDTALSPEVTLWYDHLSGDEDPADDTDTAFDTLFDTRHKFYGLIDVMNFGVGGRADGRGLQDAAVKFALKPAEGVTTKLDAHLFLASAAQGGDAVLGEEVDLTAGWQVKPGLGLLAGAASLMRPDLDPDAWAFLQLAAKI